MIRSRNQNNTAVSVTVGTALLFSAMGCEDRTEIDELESILQEALSELIEMQATANKLMALRREIHQLEETIEDGLGVFAGEELSPEVLEELAADAQLSVEQHEEGDGGWSLLFSGDGGAAEVIRLLSSASRQVPFLRAYGIEVEDDSWTVEAEVVATPAAEEKAWQPKKYDLPSTSWRSGEKSEKLRKQIDRTQRDMMQLEEIFNLSTGLQRQKEAYRDYLARLQSTVSLRVVADLVLRLMDLPAAPLNGGRVIVEGEKISVKDGLLASDSSTAAIGRALGDDWVVRDMERGDAISFRVFHAPEDDL